ncbi:MAG: TIGR04283 family arsenosugar biosynthesis glycosyltransferase [Methyloligellaceae bacterium]
MITVVIPTLNSDQRLVAVMSALVPGVINGLIKEVIVVDGGSTNGDAEKLAEDGGARYIKSSRGRGSQLRNGAEAAKGNWLLFLHADTVLEPGWEVEVHSFMDRIYQGQRQPSAAFFRFRLDDFGYMPRVMEFIVGLRCFLFALPYGDQGLLVPTALYKELGGFKNLPLMEDVDIVRRLGRRRLVMLRSGAVTSAKRYQRDGYVLRMLRNLSCLTLYYLRVPPRYISRIYG